MDQATVGQGLFDSERQLQILIVGDSIAGLTLAILLKKRGFDPLVLQTATDHTSSKLTTLWNPIVRLLQRVGVDHQDLENVVELADLCVISNATDGQLEKVDADTNYTHSIVFPTSELNDTLHTQFADDRFLKKAIASLSDREDSVTVQFDDGVAESFDLVVNAGSKGLLDPSGKTDEVKDTHFMQAELITPIDHDRRRTTIEGWIDNVLVQQIPSPESPESAVLRMTTRKDSIPVETVVRRWRRRTAEEPLGQAEKTAWDEQVVVDRTGTPKIKGNMHRWADGRQVVLPSAAVGFPPASGFHIGFGIEDARVLADEITHASDSPATIGNRFADRRRNRFNTIRNRAITVSPIHSYPVEDTEPFKTVTAFRSVCLGTFCATELTDLQEHSDVGS